MKHAITLVVAFSFLALSFANAEDASAPVKTTIRFESGPLTMLLSAHRIDFTANEAPERQTDGRGVLPRRCVLTGDARISIADGDVVIAADRLEFNTRAGSSLPTSIKGTGSCKWTDSESTLSADRLTVVNGSNAEFTFAGNAVLVRGSGNGRVRLTATKFTVVDGKFIGEGRVVVDSVKP